MYLNIALVVRTQGDPAAITPSVRAALREVDAGQPLVNVRTMETAMAGSVAQPRLQMVLLLIFAGGRGHVGGDRRLRRDGLYRVAARGGDWRAHGHGGIAVTSGRDGGVAGRTSRERRDRHWPGSAQPLLPARCRACCSPAPAASTRCRLSPLLPCSRQRRCWPATSQPAAPPALRQSRHWADSTQAP